KGRQLSVTMPPILLVIVIPTELVIKPGEIITLCNPEVAMESEAQQRRRGLMQVDTPTISITPGKYKIAYGGMIQSHPTLTTGTVEFEVKEPAKPVTKDDVAWGKEAGDLNHAKLDIDKIDRRIAKEPRYESKAPWYCLLLLGEAKTKVWMVLDGNKLY